MIILGGKVKKIRKNLGLTQKELSQGICTQVTISKIENYNNVPSMRILSELCKRLSISIHDICKTEAGSNNAYEVFKYVTSDNYIKVPYIYYNSAKIYSQLEDYSTAIQLCTQGILFLKEREITYLLDALLYEQGYNLYQNKQKKEAEKYYLMASGVSFFKGNKILLDVIKKDCINFKLRSSELLQEVKL